MIKCTAPIRGHRSPRAKRDCPMCGNRTAKTSRNSKPQYSHAERVKQLSNTPKLQYNSTLGAYIDYLTMEYVYKRSHIPLTITRTQWAVGPGFFHTGTIRANDTQFTYVYDCGTARSFDLLQNEVDTYISSLRSTWPANRIIDDDIHEFIKYYDDHPYRPPYYTPCHPRLSLRFPYIFNLAHAEDLTFSGTPFNTEWETDTVETTQQAQVDIIFISHFDTDHIKGLAYLIQNAAIKEVAIPFTTPHERFLHLCRSTFDRGNDYKKVVTDQYSDFIFTFTADPSAAMRRVAQLLESESREIVLRVIHHERDNKDAGQHDFIRHVKIPTNRHNTSDIHHTSERVPVWLFSASTLRGNAYKLGEKLINSLIKQGIIEYESDLENAAKLQDIFKDEDTSSKIADTYRSIADKNLNATSLILHSGPAHPEDSPAFHHMFWRGDHTHKFHSILEIHSPWATGWLGCGDANLNKTTNANLFEQLFWKQKLFSSTFAPPHHGSQHDWNQHLLDAFGYPTESAPVCVFSADGLYKHPSPNVIADANSRGATTYVVTTDPKSRLTETLAILVPTE